MRRNSSRRSSKTVTGKSVILTILRVAFGGLFFYSGLRKLIDPISFLQSVRGFRFFEHLSTLTGIQFDASPLEAWIAMGLPWLEMLCGVTVLIGIFDRGGLTILCGLMLVFITALTSAWARDLEISCGCFGDSAIVTNYFFEILLRFAFLAAGGTLLFFAFREKSGKTLAPAE
ncbi:MAG: putative oxidoreductase [Verrucomicrobiales bacterium]|jgi:putative oxidoreductase